MYEGYFMSDETKVETEVEVTSDTGSSIAEAVKQGSEAAVQSASQVLPAIGGFLSQSVYNTFYYTTYGVVFSALMVGHLFPTESNIVKGVHDGTEAAKDAVMKREQPVVIEEVNPATS